MGLKKYNRTNFTINYDFYSNINVDYITEVFRQYAYDKYKNHSVSMAEDIGISRVKTYRVIKGYRDLSQFSYSEFLKILKALGYKVQYKIVPV